MKLTTIRVLFLRQVKDTIKNKATLIQFLLLPIMTAIMTMSITLDDIAPDFFVKMFGSMYLGMAPLVTMSSILAEEKEQNTLRMLLFSNVKASEYLLGIGGYVFLCCTLGSFVIGCFGGYTASQLFVFMCFSVAGILISILIGAFIGVQSRNQMEATSLTLPLMMVFSFIPMLSTFNDTIAKIGEYTFTQQINLMFDSLSFDMITAKSMLVIGITFCLAMLVFALAYRKKHTIL